MRPCPAIAALVLVAAGGCSNGATPPPAVPPEPLHFQRLTGTPASESAPALSPDGVRVAYERDNEIWILEVATRSARRVAARGNHPSWSADGAALLFVRRDLDGGGPLHRLVRLHLASGVVDTVSADSVDAYEPAAAPLGAAIALRTLSRQSTLQSLRVIRGDGGARATLTEPGAWVDTAPAWSADGAWIAFVRLENGGQSRLLRVPAGGEADPVLVADGGAGASGPAWLPDGRILFSRGGVISSIPAGGGPVSVFVRGDGFALDPTVSADGRRLVFAWNRGDNFELWQVHDAAGLGAGPYDP